MNSQGRGQRFLVLGAGVLLIGSLGVGSASATDYTGGNTCVEVSGYDHPQPRQRRRQQHRQLDDGTDTDNPLDALTDTLTDLVDGLPTTDLPTTDLPTTDLPTTGPPDDRPPDRPDLPTTDLPTTDLPIRRPPATDLLRRPRTGYGHGHGHGRPVADSAADLTEHAGPPGGRADHGLRLRQRRGHGRRHRQSGATLTTTDEGDNYDSGYRHGRLQPRPRPHRLLLQQLGEPLLVRLPPRR